MTREEAKMLFYAKFNFKSEEQVGAVMDIVDKIYDNFERDEKNKLKNKGENMKYAVVFLWDAMVVGGSLNEVVDKIILFDSKEEAEEKLNNLWNDYFDKKVEEIRKSCGNDCTIYANKDSGIIEYWNKDSVFKTSNVYSAVIKEIDKI